MGKSSRDKGSRGEREVASIMREHGFDVARVPNSGGLRWKGDVRGMDGIHIEVKRQERLKLPEWLQQARQEAERNEVPAVIFRRSGETWTAAIPLEAFLSLVSEAELWRDSARRG